MHMSDKSTTLKQTHSEPCQGQPPFLTKLWTSNVWLKAAPMNPNTRTQQDLQRQPDPVIWELCFYEPPRSWSRTTERDQGRGERPAPVLTKAAMLALALQLGERFCVKDYPWLKNIKEKTTDSSNSILLMKKRSAREVLLLTKKNHRPRWRHQWYKKGASASPASFLPGDPTFLSLMKFGSRPTPYVSPPSTIPPPMAIFFPSSRQVWPFLFVSWNRSGCVMDFSSWGHKAVSALHRNNTHPGSIKAFPKCYCSCGCNFLPTRSQKNLGAYPRKGKVMALGRRWEKAPLPNFMQSPRI